MSSAKKAVLRALKMVRVKKLFSGASKIEQRDNGMIEVTYTVETKNRTEVGGMPLNKLTCVLGTSVTMIVIPERKKQ